MYLLDEIYNLKLDIYIIMLIKIESDISSWLWDNYRLGMQHTHTHIHTYVFGFITRL